MNITILGCHGGNSNKTNLTSFLVNENLLLDAGSASQVLSLEEQLRIRSVLVTHSHLDHIATIPFIADNIVGRFETPIEIAAPEPVLIPLKEHLFNDKIWPDFTHIPHSISPIIRLKTLENEKSANICGLTVMPVKVHHAVPAYGYIIRENGNALAYTGDTGPTNRIWEVINKEAGIKGIITEISYPNRMKREAEISCHMTLERLLPDLDKIEDKEIPIYIYHLKPLYEEEIIDEIKSAGRKNITILKRGDVIEI